MNEKTYSESSLAVIRLLMKKLPEVREGRMFGYPAFFIGKRMFACVYENGVGVKLPATEVTNLLGRNGNVPFQPGGKPRMREWVQLNRSRADDYLEESRTFEQSARFVRDINKGGNT